MLSVHVINRETGALTAYTPSQLYGMARSWAKSTGRKYKIHWLEFDNRGSTRLIVQTEDKSGWSQSNGIVL